jgi:hypothetical protein
MVLMPPGVVLMIAVQVMVLMTMESVVSMMAAQRVVMAAQREVGLQRVTHSCLCWLTASFEGSAPRSFSLMFFFHAPAVRCVPLLQASEAPLDCQ